MKNPLGNLMQQAQKMQENFQKAQEELAAMEVQGESGGGLVKVAMNGQSEVLRISIDDSLIKEDKDMLEDLVAAAMNDVIKRVNKMKEEKMAELTSGFQLPAGVKLPF